MRSTARSQLRPVFPLVTIIAAMLLLAACSGGTAASAPASTEQSAAPSAASAAESAAESATDSGGAAQTITITDTSFGVEEITVSAGDSVRWVNDSGLPHTVTEGQDGNSVDGARFNEQVQAGESVEVTFDETGDYDVTCLFHSNMNMVVHVE